MQPPQLTQQQFETFVLIYASHVDYNYSPEERKYILSQTTTEVHEDMLELYSTISDYQSLKVILDHKKKFCNSTTSRQLLYDKIIAVFQSDGEYTRGEKTFLEFLDKMIKSQQ